MANRQTICLSSFWTTQYCCRIHHDRCNKYKSAGVLGYGVVIRGLPRICCCQQCEKSHSECANAFFTSCTLTSLRVTSCSKYMYSAVLHSRRLSHITMDMHSTILRQPNLSEQVRTNFGIKCGSNKNSTGLPKRRFSASLYSR